MDNSKKTRLLSEIVETDEENVDDNDSDNMDFEVPQYNKKPRQSVVAQKRASTSRNYVKRRSTVSDFRKIFKENTKREFQVQKIRICGPPLMSDNFDRDLQSLVNERDDELQKKIDMVKLIKYSKRSVNPSDGDSEESLIGNVNK